jgi:DNA (cytosine-5)-methyltransferase 1
MLESLQNFLLRANRRAWLDAPCISVFSGAGLSDLGYELAGFSFKVQCESDPHRAELGKRNFPHSKWIVGDVQGVSEELMTGYRQQAGNEPLAIMSVTPPCQGMSSSNPGRGKIASPEQSDYRNTLLLDSLSIVGGLEPRIIVAENVAPLLNRVITWQGKTETIAKAFVDGLPDYRAYAGVVEMADYGIPQMRKRSIIVAIHKDEPILARLDAKKLLPWPRPTHAQNPAFGRAPWLTFEEWLEKLDYPVLDARTRAADPTLLLHNVPAYPIADRRYEMIADIPPRSGRNAYSNSTCPWCRQNSIPSDTAYCPHCGGFLTNRPIVQGEDLQWRLIKGFESSYRRAGRNRPAPTVTTNSSHLGSDNKIHPWENRVMSTLECADLQTVPRFYDWSWALSTRHNYVIRNAIGEALPPYFTYLHGKVLSKMLDGSLPESRLSRAGIDGQDRSLR